MSKVEKISVALTPELADALRVAVDAGDYASTSEAIRDAVREWTRRREERAAKLADLRAAIQAGIDSGPSELRMSVEERLAYYRRRLAESRGA